jgi:CspA family cold shock protein
MPTGVVQKYFEDRGFGFIRPDDGGGDIFFHVRFFLEKTEPTKGDRVEFEIGTDSTSGRPKAERLRLL